MWSNDIKCKYMLIFPLNKLAGKELACMIRVTLLGPAHLYFCPSAHVKLP